MDKLLSKIKLNKKIVIFLAIISGIAIISGSLLVVLLDKSDKIMISSYLTNFINDLSQYKIEYISVLEDSLINYITLILGIWLLGISVIGLPILLLMFFSKTFILGFSIGSIINCYK